MRRIAITGGIATGKSTLRSRLISRGLRVLDADELAHECLREETIRSSIAARFGPEILGVNGEIDRKSLSSLAFDNGSHLEFLERLIHPCVNAKIDQIAGDQSGMLFVEVPLLQSAREYDLVINVHSPLDVRIDRLQLRGMTPEDSARIMSHQANDLEYAQSADFQIDGTLSPKALDAALDAILDELQGDSR
jgi:dephospho-CoA kinase